MSRLWWFLRKLGQKKVVKDETSEDKWRSQGYVEGGK